MAKKEIILQLIIKYIGGGRVASALPDFITCGFFIIAFIAPDILGMSVAKELTWIYILEFLVLQTQIFFFSIVYDPRTSKRDKIKQFRSLTFMYLIFISIVFIETSSWWLCAIIAWLLLSRFGALIFDTLPDEKEHQRQKTQWTASTIIYMSCALGMFLLVEVIQTGTVTIVNGIAQEVTVWGIIYFGSLGTLILFDANQKFINFCIKLRPWVILFAILVMGGWTTYWTQFGRYL